MWRALPEENRGFCQINEESTPQAAQSEKIDSYITEQMKTRGIPGLALGIVERGKFILKKAYGVGNLETDTPVKTNSIFELASLTKQFTAAAIMMLVEEGKLRLDDSIIMYISNAPEAWKNITVRHLLTHTSGLQLGAIVWHEGSPLLNISTKQAFDSLANTHLLFQPGERCPFGELSCVKLADQLPSVDVYSFSTEVPNDADASNRSVQSQMPVRGMEENPIQTNQDSGFSP